MSFPRSSYVHLASLTAAVLVAGQVQAGMVAEYAFDSPAGTLDSTGDQAGVTATQILPGAGLTSGPSNQSWNNSSFSYHSSARSRFVNIANTAGSESDSFNGNDYVEFTLTADPGKTLNLDSFSFAHARGGSGAEQFTVFNGVRSSLDSFGSSLGTFDTTSDAVGASTTGFTAGDGWEYNTISLGSAFDALSIVTFRLYFWETGLKGDQDGFFTRIDSVRVEGTVVPEPAAIGIIAVGALATLRRRRA
jgi:hypothetical protein